MTETYHIAEEYLQIEQGQSVELAEDNLMRQVPHFSPSTKLDDVRMIIGKLRENGKEVL